MKKISDSNSFVLNFLNTSYTNSYKKSQFNFLVDFNKGYILFNTFTRAVFYISQEEYDIYSNVDKYYNFKTDFIFNLVANGFWVDTNCDETTLYCQVFKLQKTILSNFSKKKLFKIFVTTNCNARCFYCFEEGIKHSNMLPETAKEVVNYILNNKADEKITLYWFGGEPLCNIKPIETITKILNEQNVNFESKIITNGFLFDENLILKAKNDWHLKYVQITFDGTEEEHNKRKSYIGKTKLSPFIKTIENVDSLLSAGIFVSLRLNFDENNLDDIEQLVEFLSKRYKFNNLLSVYPSILADEWLNHQSFRTEQLNKDLHVAYRKLYFLLQKKGLLHAKKVKKEFKSNFCMANTFECATISTNGELFTCQSCDSAMKYGDISTGISNSQLLCEWVNSFDIPPKCGTCVFLPECTPFNKCPKVNTFCQYDKETVLSTRLIKTLLSSKFKHKIADFIIEVADSDYDVFNEIAFDYICEEQNTDLFVKIEFNDLQFELNASEARLSPPPAFLHSTAVQRKFSEWLPSHNAFVLHSATFDVGGVGVAFAAHSGTGKTTHMNLWQQLLGDKMTVVNGDKPIVRFFDDEPETPYAYGTPWNGKEHMGCNMRTPLKHICFIERSETNYVEKVNKQDIVNQIFNQVYMPKDPVAIMNTMQLIDRLLSCTNLWIIHCNMEPEAAEIAYNTIINGKTE